jgi:sugar-specific transcriptional regulator TrmB
VIPTNELLLKLEKLGLSSYEAKAYLALMQKSPANGYEISKLSKIPAAKVYETLNKLKNKGFILAHDYIEPVRYYPVPPAEVLATLQAEYMATIDSLRLELDQVQPLPNIDLAWNLSGYDAVMEKSAEIIESAVETLFLSVWPQEAERFQSLVDAAVKRNVKFVANVFGADHYFGGNAVNLAYCGKSSQKRLGKKLTVLVADSKEVLISEIGDDETLGAWTFNPGIVLVAKEYIRHDIWGRMLIGVIGEERFQQMCRDDELLNYIINVR